MYPDFSIQIGSNPIKIIEIIEQVQYSSSVSPFDSNWFESFEWPDSNILTVLEPVIEPIGPNQFERPGSNVLTGLEPVIEPGAVLLFSVRIG